MMPINSFISILVVRNIYCCWFSCGVKSLMTWSWTIALTPRVNGTCSDRAIDAILVSKSSEYLALLSFIESMLITLQLKLFFVVLNTWVVCGLFCNKFSTLPINLLSIHKKVRTAFTANLHTKYNFLLCCPAALYLYALFIILPEIPTNLLSGQFLEFPEFFCALSIHTHTFFS